MKSFYGNEFSEKILLYEILKIIYPNRCISFSGKDLADMKIDGAPDYYIRKGKDILLFESKDFLIPAVAKESFDFAIYENEFEKKLYFEDLNGKEKHKAVMQLIGCIRKILKNHFTADKDFNYREVSIFPILLVHDQQYNTAGFNTLVNYWFQTELQLLQEDRLYINRIKPLVVVNIDSLIYHQVGLKESIPLHKVLREFFKHTHFQTGIKFHTESEAENYIIPRLIPFSVFISRYFAKKGLKNRKTLLDLIISTIYK